MRFETLAVHAGAEADAETGAIASPLHMSTTFKHGPAGERVAGYEYQRESNPTQDRLETCLAALEGGCRALVYGSGMAAMQGLSYVPLRMERDGTSVVLYNPELTSNYVPAVAKVS